MTGAPNFSSNFNNLQNLTPEQLYQLQQYNQQQIQQIQAQLAQVQLTGNGGISSPVYGTSYQPLSPTAQPVMTSGHLFPTSPQHTPINNPFEPMSPTGPGPSVPLGTSLTMNVNLPPQQRVNNVTPFNQVSYPNTSAGINGQLSNQIHVDVANNPTSLQSSSRTVNTPDTLHLQHVNHPRGASLSGSSYSSSTPSTPQDSPATTKKPDQQQRAVDQTDAPTYMQRPRQQVTSPSTPRPPLTSDRSSTSSASIPGSPSSSGNPPFSPEGSLSDSFGAISPEGTPTKKWMNGEIKSPGSQIKNKPLQMETKYPQDKCYSCMKKVYPMEKLGPVRGVVFHKGCFRCKTCKSTLNMKNFFHNQVDQFDKSVYCKSHQTIATDKGGKLDADSLEIKSALNAPKKGGVTPESERAPVHKYSYDVTSREIEHARRVPVADLQPGVKVQRSNAWSKSKRETHDIPVNVVKHDEQLPEYDVDGYNRHIIETQPDY
ncbi:hypothetical protein ACF0H5_014193 [Mactra antiquata]